MFYITYNFYLQLGFFVQVLFPFCSCTMCPDSSGKLIRLMHICQPASFSLATALKVLNAEIDLHQISLFLLLRLQCNLQQQFKFFTSKKGIVLAWKTRATEELLWKTSESLPTQMAESNSTLKKIQWCLTNPNSRPLKFVTQQQTQNVVVISWEVDCIFLNSWKIKKLPHYLSVSLMRTHVKPQKQPILLHSY